MFLKALIAVCLLQVSVETGNWRQIARDACVRPRDNNFKEIRYIGPEALIGALKLVRKSGRVGCHARAMSYWGCLPNHVDINMYVTDTRNQVIYPSKRLVHAREGGWYHLPGFTSSSPQLVFTDVGYPKYAITRGTTWRIWYGEDLFNYTEGDNHGQICMDVWVYIL